MEFDEAEENILNFFKPIKRNSIFEISRYIPKLILIKQVKKIKYI